MLRLVVFPHQSGLRIDKVLADATGVSRRQARRLLAEGTVARNGRPCRVQSKVVDMGDVLDLLEPPPEVERGSIMTAPVVSLCYEDPWLLVAEKPSGVLSQPADRASQGESSFDEQVLLFLAYREGKRPFLRLIHRLDRVTSGLLLFARVPQALEPLARVWKERRAQRRYLAVVEGRPRLDEEIVEAPIARVSGGLWRFEVSGSGRPARTQVRIVERRDRISLVECRLLTGRTHQVRVHLAHMGHPVAGDRLYGATLEGFPRPMLHAASLELPHPRTGKRLRVEAPMPEDMLVCLR